MMLLEDRTQLRNYVQNFINIHQPQPNQDWIIIYKHNLHFNSGSFLITQDSWDRQSHVNVTIIVEGLLSFVGDSDDATSYPYLNYSLSFIMVIQ